MERARIVVGVDGSAATGRAVGLLEDVHDPAVEPAARRARVHDRAERTWCAGLASAAFDHRVVVRDGPPVDVLLAVARDEHADLVVVGSRGVGAAQPALVLGSTSLHVLQAARCPVLVVPERPQGDDETAPLELRHTLVGVDCSAPSLAALDLAADLAETAGGSLCVLEVFEYVPPFPLGPAVTRTSEAEERALERTSGLVEAHARAIRDRGIGVQVIVRSGDPAPTLLEVADDVPHRGADRADRAASPADEGTSGPFSARAAPVPSRCTTGRSPAWRPHSHRSPTSSSPSTARRPRNGRSAPHSSW